MRRQARHPKLSGDAQRLSGCLRQTRDRGLYLAKSAHLGSSLSCIEILDCIIRASGLTLKT